MLRVTTIADSAAAKAYFSVSDYHLEGQELEAHWHGRGAELLGLAGSVDFDQFGRLCDNLHPGTGNQLTKYSFANRRVGYDFTWSVPKSVSVAYALGGDARIVDAFREAVNETMAEMEREMRTRVRAKGQNTDRVTGNLVWADFVHQTSRPIGGIPDPQLHCHVVAFNATFDREEGKWKAGEFGPLKADAPYFQAAFRARLANKLQGLGYAVTRTKDDFQLTAIPATANTKFSRRTAQIDRLADQLGITNPTTKAKLGATSRERKQPGQTWGWLQEQWVSRLTNSEKQSIETAAEYARECPVLVEDANAAAMDWAMRHCFERASVVSQRKLVTEALKYGVGRVTVEGVHEQLGRPELIRRKVGEEVLVTSHAVLSDEKRMIQAAVRGRGQCRPLRGSTTKELVGANTSDLATLSPSQQAAVHHVWASPDRVMVIRGVAGSGKTTLTRAAVTGIESTGKRVLMLAPSSEASRGVLRSEGFATADTLAKFLLDRQMQDAARGQVVMLDEASLAGQKDLGRLIGLAEHLDFRLVCLGDRLQHRAVAAGDPLKLLEEKAGIKAVEVTEIKRQKGAYRQAVEAFAKGDAELGMKRLDALGWLKEAGHDALVADYLAATGKGKQVLVVAPTHAEGDKLTATIREQLKATGRLHGEEREFVRLVAANLSEAELANAGRPAEAGDVAQFHRAGGKVRVGQRVALAELDDRQRAAGGFAVYREAVVLLTPGDLIRITAGGKDYTGKHRLNTGAVYTVSGFTDAGNVRLSNGWVLDKSFGHWAPGYVTTSHASQGKTVDVTLIAMSRESFPAVNQATAYVSASRGREKAVVYTEDKSALFDAAQRPDTRLLATDLVRVKPRPSLRARLKRHCQALYRMSRLGRIWGQERTPQPHQHHQQQEYSR